MLTAARHSNASNYVVIITGYDSIDSAVTAVREGAYDRLAKPFALGQFESGAATNRGPDGLEAGNRELSRRVVSHEGKAPAIARGGRRRFGAAGSHRGAVESADLTSRFCTKGSARNDR
jgi:DNA-binding NtrC family response regulator